MAVRHSTPTEEPPTAPIAHLTVRDAMQHLVATSPQTGRPVGMISTLGIALRRRWWVAL